MSEKSKQENPQLELLYELSGTTISYTQWHINRDKMANEKRNLETHQN